MMWQAEGTESKVYLFRCGVCGRLWEKRFVSREEVEKYLRYSEVCSAGRHMVKGGLRRVVSVYE